MRKYCFYCGNSLTKNGCSDCGKNLSGSSQTMNNTVYQSPVQQNHVSVFMSHRDEDDELEDDELDKIEFEPKESFLDKFSRFGSAFSSFVCSAIGFTGAFLFASVGVFIFVVTFLAIMRIR